MEKFCVAMECCGLNDLGFQGSRYTWNNGRDDVNFTKKRLDRALGNSAWCTMFNDAAVRVLAARSSDHKPLLIHFDKPLYNSG